VKRFVIFSPYNRFHVIYFSTSLLLWLKRGPATFGVKVIEGDRQYSIFEYFPFKPMNNKFNVDTRAALGGRQSCDRHRTKHLFNKYNLLGYLLSKIKNNTVSQYRVIQKDRLS